MNPLMHAAIAFFLVVIYGLIFIVFFRSLILSKRGFGFMSYIVELRPILVSVCFFLIMTIPFMLYMLSR